jgi:cell division protein FtsL
MEGSAVREVFEFDTGNPEDGIEKRQNRNSEKRVKSVNSVKSVGPADVILLTVVCLLTAMMCIRYLQLRSSLICLNENIAATEKELSEKQAVNDADYQNVMSSVTMDDVRDAALNRLGMHYATESQIRYYESDDENYVRQYEDLDEN